MRAKKPATQTTKPPQAGQSYTHRKRGTQLLIEQAALYRLSAALNSETELQAIMDVAARAAAELFKVELAAIALVDEGGSTYSGKANVGWSPEIFSRAQHVPLDSNSGLMFAIRHQMVVAIPDETKETRFGAPTWVGYMNIRSTLLAPMIVAGKAIGGLVVNDRQPRDWSEGEQRLIALVANHTAEAIERANLTARLAKSERRFRTLIEHSADGVALVSAEGNIQYQSSSGRRIVGDITAGQNAFELVYPDDLPEAVELFKRLLESPRSSVMAQFRFRHGRGVWIWLEATGTNLLDDPDVQMIVVNYRDITERKRSELVLRESEERFSKTFRFSPIAIGISTLAEGRIIDVNDAYLRMFGYDSKGEVLGRTTLELNIYRRGQSGRNTILQQIQRQGYVRNYENHFYTRSGEERYALASIEQMELNGEQCLLSFTLDITERKRAEESLRQSQERYEWAIRATHEGIWEWNITTNQIYSSPRWKSILGFEDHEIPNVIGELEKRLHPDDREQFSASIQAYLDGQAPSYELEFRALHKDGSYRWIHSRAIIVRDADGKPVRLVGAHSDITERKQAELILRQSEERFSKVFHSSPIAISIHTFPDGRIVDLNTRYLRMFGFDSKDEMIGRTTIDLGLWVDLAERNSLIEQIQLQGYVRNFEVRFRTRGGEICYALASIEQFELNSEPCVLAFTVDITQRKRLELQQNRLAAALDAAGEMIIITDADVKIQYVNPAFEYITGYMRDEALGRNPNMLQGERQEEEFYRAMWSALRQGDVWHGVVTDKKKSGDLFQSENTIAPIHDALGDIVGYVSVQRDITERVQHERELEAIAQLSVALRTAAVLADMTPLLLDQLLDLLKADSAVLIMRDAVSGDSVVEAVRGVPILEMSDRLGAGKGVAGYVIESGQPYLSQDLENDPRFARRMMIQGRWAAAFTPLATREQIIGALCIARQSASIPIEDLRLLNTIGELAANAIHRASLHEQTRRRLKQLSTLHNIDRATSSSFDLRLTLNIALDELTQYAGVGAASVLFLNHNLMTLEYAAERGFPRHLSKAPPLNINQSYAGRAVLENQAVVADLATSNGFPELDALAKEGFTRYDGVPLIAKGKIRGVLEVFSHPSLGAEPNWMEFLETVANGLALAIDNMELFNGLQRSNSELGLAYDATLEGWSRALDLRDKETEGHTQRVTEMTLRLANAMNLDVTEMIHLRRGSLLHDIGKLGVPDRILLKPGPLTDDEWDIMRQHPQYAYDMLSPIPFLAPALVIPYSHHEKWDGTGYPRGLKSDAIPLAARIFAVADVWDALRSDRPYRKGWEEEKVRDHILEQSGKHFDPKVVEVFLALEG